MAATVALVPEDEDLEAISGGSEDEMEVEDPHNSLAAVLSFDHEAGLAVTSDWRASDYLPRAQKTIPVPWLASTSKDPGPNAITLFQGAMEDLADGREFTSEDWEATLATLLDDSLAALLAKLFEERPDEEPEIRAKIRYWLNYGFKAEVETEHPRRLYHHLPRLQIALTLYDQLARAEDFAVFSIIQDSELLEQLVDIYRSSALEQVRLEVGNILNYCFCAMVSELDNRKTDPARAQKFVDEVEKLEKMLRQDTMDVAEARREESTALTKLNIASVTNLRLFNALAQLQKGLTAPDPDVKKLKTCMATFFEAFERGAPICRYLFLQSNTFAEICKTVFSERATNEELCKILELGLQYILKQDGLPYLTMAWYRSKLEAFFSDFSAKEDAKSGYGSTALSCLAENLIIGFQTLQLIEDFMQSVPKEKIYDLDVLESESLINPLRSLLNLIHLNENTSKITCNILKFYFPHFYRILELVKQENDLKKQRRMLGSNLMAYSIDVMLKVFKVTSCPKIWSSYAEKLVAFQKEHKGLFSAHGLQWVTPVSDPPLRSIRHGNVAAFRKMRELLRNSNDDFPTPELVQQLRLIAVSLHEERDTPLLHVQAEQYLLEEIFRIFRDTTDSAYLLWRLEKSTVRKDGFLYSEFFTTSLEILAHYQEENDVSNLMPSLLKILAICQCFEGTREANLRETIHRLIFSRIFCEKNGKKEVNVMLLDSVLKNRAPGLYPEVLRLFRVLLAKAGKSGMFRRALETLRNVENLVVILKYPSAEITKLSMEFLAALTTVSPLTVQRILGQLLAGLKDEVTEPTSQNLDGVMDISDDEEGTEQGKMNEAGPTFRKTLVSASKSSVDLFRRLNQYLPDSVPEFSEMLASLIRDSAELSETWALCCNLALNGADTKDQQKFTAEFWQFASKICSVSYGEAPKIEASVEAVTVTSVEAEGPESVQLDFCDDPATREASLEIEEVIEAEVENEMRPKLPITILLEAIFDWKTANLHNVENRLLFLMQFAADPIKLAEFQRVILKNCDLIFAKSEFIDFSEQPIGPKIVRMLLKLLEGPGEPVTGPVNRLTEILKEFPGRCTQEEMLEKVQEFTTNRLKDYERALKHSNLVTIDGKLEEIIEKLRKTDSNKLLQAYQAVEAAYHETDEAPEALEVHKILAECQKIDPEARKVAEKAEELLAKKMGTHVAKRIIPAEPPKSTVPSTAKRAKY